MENILVKCSCCPMGIIAMAEVEGIALIKYPPVAYFRFYLYVFR